MMMMTKFKSFDPTPLIPPIVIASLLAAAISGADLYMRAKNTEANVEKIRQLIHDIHRDKDDDDGDGPPPSAPAVSTTLFFKGFKQWRDSVYTF